MYQTQHHSDYFLAQDQATQKRFKMVRQLSENYTKANTVAQNLDKMLMEFKAIDEPAPEKKSHPLPKKSVTKIPPSPAPRKANGNIEDEFEHLFERLKNAQSPVQEPSLDTEQVEQLIADYLQAHKITYEDLDTGVKNRFNALPVVLQYELPDKDLPPFQKPPIEQFQQMVDDVLLGHNLFLIGGAGTGKTFTAENLIAKAALNRPHITINCSQWTSPTEIIGGQTMEGYVEGKMIEAWKNGWVLVLDELPKLDPNTAGLFNDALSKTKLPEAIIFNARKEKFTKHPDFACIATGNIYPNSESMRYGANNKQDLSLLDRFSGSVYFIEKNPIIEQQIVQNNLIWSICDKLRSDIEELRYEAQLSLRFMQTARDAYNLEHLRLTKKDKKGIAANDGKTLKSAIDAYLSTFTELQQRNLKDRMRYDELIGNYQYRAENANTFFKF